MLAKFGKVVESYNEDPSKITAGEFFGMIGYLTYTCPAPPSFPELVLYK